MSKQVAKMQVIETQPLQGEINPLHTTRKLGDIETYVIGKAVAKLGEEVKDAIPSGKLEGIVDKTIHIQFGWTKYEDVEKMVVQTAKPWTLLAAALNRLNNVSIEAIVEDAERLAESDELKAKRSVETALEKIKGKTLKMTKGQVRVAGLIVEEVVS